MPLIRLAREICSDKARALALAMACLALVLLVVQSLRQGGFFDEFATLWFSDPALSLGDTYTDKWIRETNPPLFYLLVYAIRAVHEVDLAGLRLINAFGYAFAAGYLAYLALSAAKLSQLRAFAIVALVLFVSSRIGVHYFALLRGYYLQFSLGIVFCASLSCLVLGLSVNRRVDQVLCFVTGLVLLNIHFMSAALAGMLLSAAVIYCLTTQQRRLAGFLAVYLIVGILPEAAFIAASSSYLSAQAEHFWIRTSELEALKEVARAGIGAFSRNAVLAVLLAVQCVEWVSKSRLAPPPKRSFDLSVLGGSDVRHARFALLLIVVACSFLTILLIANLYRPIVIGRYLVPATAALLVALSLIAADMLSRRPRFLAAFIANGILIVAINGVSAIKPPAQETDGGALIAELAGACPDTIVYGIWRGDDMRGALPPAYRYAARRHGITIEPRPVAEPWTPRRSAICPTVLWAVHWPPQFDIRSEADFRTAYLVRAPDLSVQRSNDQGSNAPPSVHYVEPPGNSRILILPAVTGNGGG